MRVFVQWRLAGSGDAAPVKFSDSEGDFYGFDDGNIA